MKLLRNAAVFAIACVLCVCYLAFSVPQPIRTSEVREQAPAIASQPTVAFQRSSRARRLLATVPEVVVEEMTTEELEDAFAQVDEKRETALESVEGYDASLETRLATVPEPCERVPWDEDPSTVEEVQSLEAEEQTQRMRELDEYELELQRRETAGEYVLFWMCEAFEDWQRILDQTTADEDLLLAELD